MTINSAEKHYSQQVNVSSLGDLSNEVQYLDKLVQDNLNIRIPSYQICKNWLYARRGYPLSNEDSHCYQRLVNVLKEIGELMQEITTTIVNDRLKKLEILEKLKAVLVEKLEIEPEKIIPAANFTQDFGADSLDTVQIVMALEQTFDIEISDQVAETLITVKQVVDYISQNFHITV